MLLICFGTRPEWLKILPIIKMMNKSEYRLLFTGQHEDLLDGIEVDYHIKLSDSTNRLNQIISDCLIQFPDKFSSVLIQGDTASAFACALAAFNRNMKIYYLESGLRTYNLQHPYPEEGYRQMISRIADIHFCPTNLSKQNLTNEITNGTLHVVGNTVLDNLLPYKDECEYEDIVLVTLHRRENHGIIDKWFTQINEIATKYKQFKFVLPIHPNPSVTKFRNLLTNVNVVEPLPHTEMLNILTKTKLIITDSGGLQEEGTFFNKKIIVCRKVTERPEAIFTGHLHLCSEPELLSELFDELISEYKINTECPYGDGYSAEKVVSIIRGTV